MKQLVIGIDYGTSNSGVAYALFDDNENLTPGNVEISVIRDLAPGKFSQESDKLPSDIGYDKQWQPSGYAFEIPKDANSLQWVKLLLEPKGLSGTKRDVQRLWKTYHALGPDKPPVNVVADYLAWLWDRAKASITKTSPEKDIFKKANLTVVLTIPASWSERAKQGMLKAASCAGIAGEANNLRLLPEAEAAAIFGLKWQAESSSITENDCVIVCDAGGGTVDVVAYEILSRNPLSLDQRTASEGAFCGSVFIDIEFQNQLRLIFGDKYDSLDDEAKTRIDDKFEFDIKRSFQPQRSDGPKHFSIPWSQTEEKSIDAEVVDMSHQAVMTPIESLIESQIHRLENMGLEEKIKGILLVGGLSRSDYVYHRIHATYASQSFRVWRADNAWTAVAEGAIYCVATEVIHSRLSRHNYGILYRDGDEKKVHWIVKKGQSVESNMPTAPYALRIDDEPWLNEENFFWLSVTLVRSEQDDASEDFNERLMTPHAVIDCRFPTSIRFSEAASLVQESPPAWHIPTRFVPILNGAVISLRCKVGENEVGITEVGVFESEAASDPDGHVDPDAITTNPAPRTKSVQEDDATFWKITTNSSNNSSSRRKIKDRHFNTRMTRDTPREKRIKPGSLPGLFARGWIPREDWYDD